MFFVLHLVAIKLSLVDYRVINPGSVTYFCFYKLICISTHAHLIFTHMNPQTFVTSDAQ